MELHSQIRKGTRVYLKFAVCGEPGMVMDFDAKGKAVVFWPDLPELGRETTHAINTLVIDEAFTVRQLGLDFESQAA